MGRKWHLSTPAAKIKKPSTLTGGSLCSPASRTIGVDNRMERFIMAAACLVLLIPFAQTQPDFR